MVFVYFSVSSAGCLLEGMGNTVTSGSSIPMTPIICLYSVLQFHWLRDWEQVRQNRKAYRKDSLSFHVLVAVIRWFVMFEHRLMCNTCFVFVWLMSQPEGAYSGTHCLLFCWHKEIKKINQWSFLSVWWMIHCLCSSLLPLLIKRSCCAWVTPLTLDVLQNLTTQLKIYLLKRFQ